MKYKVHAYATIRFSFNVDANTPEDAIDKIPQEEIRNHRGHNYEYADEISGYLVDTIENNEWIKTKWYE